MRARVDSSENAALSVEDFLTKLVLLSERFSPSAATMSKMTQDAKKDEFRKYLEKAGVLELLTKSLVSVRSVISLQLTLTVDQLLSCMRNQRSQMMPFPTSRTLWGEGICWRPIARSD